MHLYLLKIPKKQRKQGIAGKITAVASAHTGLYSFLQLHYELFVGPGLQQPIVDLVMLVTTDHHSKYDRFFISSIPLKLAFIITMTSLYMC